MIRRTIFRSIIFLVPIALLLACLPARAQQAQDKPDQDKALKLKTELVEMRVVVTDKKGQLIDNLKQDDFEILDGGKPQQVSFFSVERIERPSGPKARPDASSPSGDPRVAPSRTIVFFVDTLHLSPFSFMRVKKQLRQFIDEQITDQDLVAIVTSSGTLGALQQFMRDKRMLRYAVEKITSFARNQSLFTPYIAAEVTNEVDQAIRAALQILAAEEGYQAFSAEAARSYAQSRARAILAEEASLRRVTLITLKAVSEQLAGMPGQRLVVFLSDGFSTREVGSGADIEDLRAATGRAARSGVVVYTLDAKGLTAPADFSAATPGITGASSFYISASESDQKDVLRTLAADTGGEAYLNRNDLKAPLAKILDNNRVYYAIAFYPEEARDKKKFRNVSIRVKNHPEYNVRAQKGYMPIVDSKEEVAKTPRQKLIQAMLAPLPVTNIAVTATADYLEHESDNAQVSLQVHFDGKQFQYKQQGENYLLNCEVGVAIYSASGKLVDTFLEAIKGELTAKQLEQAKLRGYRHNKRLSLKPGLYQLRIGVRDADGETVGTTSSWVEVPDLSKGKLALSSLFLGKQQKDEQAATVGGSKNTAGSKLVVGRASFKNGDLAFYRLVAYNAEAPGGASEGMIKVEILQAETPVFKGDWQPLDSRTLRRDKKGLEVGGQIKLGLEPGIYELRVTVRGAKSQKTEERTAYFEVES